MDARSFNSQNPPLPQTNVGLSGSIPTKRRWDDDIRWFEFPDRMIVTLRFFGPVYIAYNHWLKTRQNKRFPMICPAYDASTQNVVSGKCPICDDFNIPMIIETAKQINPNFNEEYDPNLKELKNIKARIAPTTQVIIRNAQNLGDPSLLSKPWHPIRLGPSVFFSLLRLKNMNICTIQGKQYTADIADPYWGRDIHIMYNSVERNPQQKYMINLGEQTPLTPVEQTYLKEIYPWESLIEYSKFDEIKQSLQINGYYQMLNMLTNAHPTSVSASQSAQYDAFMQPPSPPASYGYSASAQVQEQMMQQQPAFQQSSFHQQQQQPIPQPAVFSSPTHSQQPTHRAPAQTPPLASAPALPGLNPVESFAQTPIPSMVEPPLGSNEYKIPTPDGDLEIPFGSSERSFPLKGQQVSQDVYEDAISSFAATLSRAAPLRQADSGDLAGVAVCACFGDYQGDVPCLKCPLRPYCVHV